MELKLDYDNRTIVILSKEVTIGDLRDTLTEPIDDLQDWTILTRNCEKIIKK